MSNDGPDVAGDEPDGVLVFELDDWTTEERTSLELRLTAGGIAHRWETGSGREAVYGLEPSAAWEVGTDLVVAEQDADAVDALLDEIEFVDELEADDGDDEGDEAVYQVMADLYVAVDRLKARVEDPAVAGAFFDAADAAIDVPPPFGIDPAM
ncbi:MAG: hypothetical protein ACRD0D_02405, partial [Acidimicrobiales bacterium]